MPQWDRGTNLSEDVRYFGHNSFGKPFSRMKNRTYVILVTDLGQSQGTDTRFENVRHLQPSRLRLA